jgi:hypothetical protein
LTPLASERLDAQARAASEASGVEVSPEAMARGKVYLGLGLSVDGQAEGPALSPPVRELVDAARAALDVAKGLPLDAAARSRFGALHAAVGAVERGVGR